MTDGYHTTEYSLAVEGIRISILDRDGLEFDVSTVEAGRHTAAHAQQ